jgi:hypothetical protein
MKTKLMIGVALAAAVSTSAFAAPPRHRAVNDRDTMAPYSQPVRPAYSAPRSDVVVLGDRIVGQDPDVNVRSALEHDPVPSEY